MGKLAIRVFMGVVMITVLGWTQSLFAEPLNNASFMIKSVVAPFGQDHFLIKVVDGTNNKTGCGNDPKILIAPRSLPQFNEMVSLATAAMLAGKTIVVSQVVVGQCHPSWGRAQIDHLEVVN